MPSIPGAMIHAHTVTDNLSTPVARDLKPDIISISWGRTKTTWDVSSPESEEQIMQDLQQASTCTAQYRYNTDTGKSFDTLIKDDAGIRDLTIALVSGSGQTWNAKMGIESWSISRPQGGGVTVDVTYYNAAKVANLYT